MPPLFRLQKVLSRLNPGGGPSFVVVYMDNILRTLDHLSHIDQVLSQLASSSRPFSLLTSGVPWPGVEAIHGMFRGGTTSLSITSPNFAEFLVRMNKANQIHQAEHELKQIPGNTVVACRKHVLTKV